MFTRTTLVPVLFLLPLGIGYSQTGPFSCQASAVNLNVRAEGIAETLGDILFTCSGGIPGSITLFNLGISLNVNVTNRVTTAGVTDATLTIDSGVGPAPSSLPALLQASNSIAFNGVSFTIPASGRASLRISGIRGNVSQLGPGSQQNVIATIALSSGSPGTVVIVNTSQLAVATPSRGLLATLAATGIRCVGSPLPQTISFTNLLATGTAFVSTRVTEGFGTAFEKKQPGADNGVRIIARYAGLPVGARLLVPDAVAGSDALQPTIAGDLGGMPSGGVYVPGSVSLLLVRVNGTDSNGAGGFLAFNPGAPGSGPVIFNGMSEVPLSNGTGIAVYEVVDSSPAILETAQFATFLGLAATNDAGPVASETISLGPISTVSTATTTDPVPRFISIPAPSDCSNLHDCGASYFPSLNVVVSKPLDFTAPLGSALQTKTVQIQNLSGGIMSWTATVVNPTGPAGWLTVAPTSGVNGGTIFVNVFPQQLTAPGSYSGSVVIDTGSQSGSRTIPVTATITAAPLLPAVAPAITVAGLVSAARTEMNAVAPGSLALLTGSHLTGKDVAVSFDGTAASMLWGDDATIVIQIPASLHAPMTSQLQVTVDGTKSTPLAIPVSELAPAIFSTHGLLNADWSTNSTANPADRGSQMQILLTGMAGATPGSVFVKLYGRNLTPTFAGPASGLIGIDEVFFDLPDDLPSAITEMSVCGYGPSNPAAEVCSPVATVAIN